MRKIILFYLMMVTTIIFSGCCHFFPWGDNESPQENDEPLQTFLDMRVGRFPDESASSHDTVFCLVSSFPLSKIG